MYKKILVICLFVIYSHGASASLKDYARGYPNAYNIAYLHTKAAVMAMVGYTYLKTFLSSMLEKQWDDSLEGIAAFGSDICQPKPLVHITIAAALLYVINDLFNKTKAGHIYVSSKDVYKNKALMSLVLSLTGGLILNRLFNAAEQ